MITSKEDLDFYLAEDSKLYNVRFFDRFIFNENYHILKYLKVLRKLEYYSNCAGGGKSLLRLWYFWNYKRLCYKYRIKIGLNTCGPGLFLPHLGLIRVGTYAKVGAHCTIGPNVVIGTKGKFENIATIGDNVEICLGAKVIGKVHIGNNAIIAPNSVVIKDVEEGTIVSGVPAVVIGKTSR